MTSRSVYGAIALAMAGTMACAPALWQRLQAQEVKEQWNIDTPPPADVTTDMHAATGKHAAAGTPATSAGGASNEHGLAIVKNPYTDKADAIAQGKELFVSMACSGCHGAGGGGGMCPPVVNDIWVYGSDDTTLFNLVKLGTSGLQAKGYSRVGTEKIVGDMPPFAGIVTDEQEWKLIAYVRSKYAGDPAQRNW